MIDGSDTITENAGEGTDTVTAAFDYALGANFENLILSGTAHLNGTGNALANTITGNTAGNTLYGMDGNDVLNGGAGVDSVTDFSASQNDRIDVSAYHAQNTAVITQSGSDTVIDLGGGNTITLTSVSATEAGFLSHIVW